MRWRCCDAVGSVRRDVRIVANDMLRAIGNLDEPAAAGTDSRWPAQRGQPARDRAGAARRAVRDRVPGRGSVAARAARRARHALAPWLPALRPRLRRAGAAGTHHGPQFGAVLWRLGRVQARGHGVAGSRDVRAPGADDHLARRQRGRFRPMLDADSCPRSLRRALYALGNATRSSRRPLAQSRLPRRPIPARCAQECERLASAGHDRRRQAASASAAWPWIRHCCARSDACAS